MSAPDWNVAIIDGKPEVMINPAAVRALVKESPLGEAEARRRLIAMGYPPEYLEDKP